MAGLTVIITATLALYSPWLVVCHGVPVPGEKHWVRLVKQKDCLLASFKEEFIEENCRVTKLLTNGGQSLLYARRGNSDEENFEEANCGNQPLSVKRNHEKLTEDWELLVCGFSPGHAQCQHFCRLDVICVPKKAGEDQISVTVNVTELMCDGPVSEADVKKPEGSNTTKYIEESTVPHVQQSDDKFYKVLSGILLFVCVSLISLIIVVFRQKIATVYELFVNKVKARNQVQRNAECGIENN